MANIMRLGGGAGAKGEIAITENGVHDVKKYETASVNVQSAPVLLWTNASPTSTFSAQTVTVATGYSAYLIEIAYGTSSPNRRVIGFCSVGNSTTIATTKVDHPSYASQYDNNAGRSVTANNGALTFSNGYYCSGSNNFSATWGIPTRIWGVKFTL